MTTTKTVHSRMRRPLLGASVLCLALMLGACGGDDNNNPASPATGGGNGGNGGTTPAACTTAHCAPAP
ncbi:MULTISPECIES: hypothetical protein [unclassified Cupriavidus]|uniref:hypothetical protein n=1 Tax=unclassified Cupriavidus TaxID=2640874 RepID=UPI001C0028B6|nr:MULTISPECIES: hypothetical protein [unclassified Cupriavidus]MCA3192387.1 hypothetical protein [Cupriavidus sp.]MCA3196162.1 hypothetical protein [Cupriavidus sp.]MCA3203695.1 hypothetical protein [Cupriavidus sp.]MCA3210285.1 hypothetical protein [Cupriavidus sp.]MCA3234810.1 hypothetical protein [Cupriavidus sp.]